MEKIFPSCFIGKRAAFYGDSITYGAYMAASDSCPSSRVEKRWCDFVGEALGCLSVDNYAQSGISISSTSFILPECAMSKNYIKLRPDADVVFIAAGTNDFGTDVLLGEETDSEDVSFCGALNVLCKGLKERFPDRPVFFVLPIDRLTADAALPYDPVTADYNKRGLMINAYREKIRNIAGTRYGFFILDGSAFGFHPKDKAFRETYMLDGLHPNEEGHRLYAQSVLNELRDLDL